MVAGFTGLQFAKIVMFVQSIHISKVTECTFISLVTFPRICSHLSFSASESRMEMKTIHDISREIG